MKKRSLCISFSSEACLFMQNRYRAERGPVFNIVTGSLTYPDPVLERNRIRSRTFKKKPDYVKYAEILYLLFFILPCAIRGCGQLAHCSDLTPIFIWKIKTIYLQSMRLWIIHYINIFITNSRSKHTFCGHLKYYIVSSKTCLTPI